MDDRVEHLALDFLAGESGLVLELHRLAGQRLADDHAAFLDFQFLRLRHRNAQAERDVVGHVIAADRHRPALLHRAIDIDHVVGRAAAHVHHERAERFLILIEHDLRGRERAEDDVEHFRPDLLHAAHAVFDPRGDAVDDVKIRLELAPEHADRIEHAVLAIDVIMLEQRVHEHVRRGNAHLARAGLHVFEILLANFVALLGQVHRAAVVEALDVAAGDREINAADHHVAFFLRIHERLAHALARGFKIDDLALAHAARRRLAHAENADRAVALRLADDGADFRSSDLESDDDVFAGHFLVKTKRFLDGVGLGRRGRAF